MSAKSFRTKLNITRAWNWIKSNPDRALKDGYGMRNLYKYFTVTENDFINNIVSELRLGTYIPTPSCKIYLPKPSGGLRPYTVLTVKDQVVYQAIINIIAEQLLPKVENRYYDKIFGNLYAGENNIWFYKKWKDGYRKFNEHACKAFSSGKVFMASFDLVACYDSIDHKVLQYFLKEIGVPQDLISQLLTCLSLWTSTDYNERIYQGHGIPQGPMSSGLLSEVVLSSFDAERRTPGVSYLRYVDDIWFFAENENDLRFELVRMDRICKKVGLFPQSSKIKIRRVKNIEDELKTISNIFEDSTKIEDDDYFSFIKKITPNYRIKDISKFRYCVSVVKPLAPLIDRLWCIYANHPEIYPQLCMVIIRSGKLTKNSRIQIEKLLSRKNPYINIQASFIETLIKIKLSPGEVQIFTKIVKERFGTSSVFRNSDARITAIAFEFLYKYNKLTQNQLNFICSSPFWYTRREIARFLNNNESNLIKNYLEDEILDVQLVASNNIVSRDIQIPNKTLPLLVNLYFSNYGLLTQGINEPCKINIILSKMIGRKVNINWKILFDMRYKQALRVLVECQSSYSTNIGAWICELDVFNDILIRAIYDNDKSLNSCPDNYGSALNDNKSFFAKKYNNIRILCKDIHDRRITTTVAHAYGTKSKVPTKPFKHKEVSLYLNKEDKIINEVSKII